MSKTTEVLLVVLVMVMTIFSILSFYKLREIRNNSMMAEAWLTNIKYSVDDIQRDVNDLTILGAGGSSEFPRNVANRIDEIADTVVDLNDKFGSFEKRYTDFTKLYLQKNF